MQTVSSDFNNASEANVREPDFNVKLAWERTKDDNIDFAVVGTSLVDGNDIVQGELTEITESDLFEYTDESEYASSFSIDRQIIEPLGGVMYSRGSLVLVNENKRFSPKKDVTIGDYILSNRPIKIFAGFKYNSITKTIPRIYGLTEQPKESKQDNIVRIQIFDYISVIDEFQLESTKYVDQRSDQIIEDILTTIGFTSGQFELDEGLNEIGFAWFSKGTKAGDAIRQICQAEEGFFYQDELGLLRFDNRRKYAIAPYINSQWTFDKEDIINWEEDDNMQIINRVEVEAYPREVQGIAEIYKWDNVIEVQQGTTDQEEWATFEDPVNEITTPVATTDYVANTKSDGTGIDVTSSVSITISKFVTSAKLLITNNYSGNIFITSLRLRGTPAIDFPIMEIFEDTDSQEIYGVKSLSIRNDFITSKSFAYYLARTLVKKYKDGVRRIKISIPAKPQLQIRDKISVQDPDTDDYLDMRIMRIQEINETGTGFIQNLYCREIVDLETDTPAIVGTSLVDGEDVVWI